MKFKIEGYEPTEKETKAVTIDKWYNKSLRLWELTKRDEEGNQIGETVYVYGKKDAEKTYNEMLKELEGEKR